MEGIKEKERKSEGRNREERRNSDGVGEQERDRKGKWALREKKMSKYQN